MRILTAICLSILLSASPLALAENRIELYELQQRTVAEITSLISPLLQEDESVTGSGFKLIISAEPARLQQLQETIRKLDTRLHQLRISVRQGKMLQSKHSGAGVRGQVNVEDGDVSASGHARILSTETRRDDGGAYQVTALEGTPVYIAEGLRFPVTNSSTQIVNGRVVVTPQTEYQSATSGFFAMAQVRPDNSVVVELAPQREALVSERYGAIQGSSLSTRVQGRLNQWLQIGGIGKVRNQDGSGLAHQYSTQGRDDEQVWLKVEIIEP